MPRRFYCLIAALTVGGLFAGGCRTAPAAGGGRPPAAAASAPLALESEAALKQRAEAHAHYAAGVIHDLNDETGPALEEYYAAAKADPADEALVLEVSRRFLQERKPEREKALELLLAAAARREATGVIFARLGFVYGQLGQADKAAEANRKAIQKSPGSLAGYRNLFQSYLESKQPEEALRVLDEAAKQRSAAPEFLIELTGLYVDYALQFPKQRASVYAKGLAALARVDESKLGSPQLTLVLAEQFNQLGDAGKAAQLYRELLKQLADSPAQLERVRVKLTDLYLRLGDRKRAVEQLEAIVRDDPSNAQAYHYLGVIASEEERWTDAVEQFRKALLFDPRQEQAYYDLAGVEIESGRSGEALATLDQARNKFPQSFALEFLSGMAYAQQTNYLESMNHFTAAEIVAQATSPARLTDEFFSQVAGAQLELGQTTNALATLDRARKKFPQSFTLERLCALVYVRQKNYAEATNHFAAAEAAARATAPDRLTDGFYCQVAGAQLELGQAGDAVATLDKARKRFPKSFVVEYLAGLACSRQKNYAEAIGRFSAAEKIAHASAPERLTDAFYFQAGVAFERKGEIAPAETYFEKCIALNPDFADALNYLGYMWAERGVKLEQARDFIGRALKVEPKNAAFLDSMGWVLFKLHQPKEALDYLRQAVELNGMPDATLFDHLGDIYAALSEPDKAREAWRKSLAVEPNEEIKKKLDAAK